jgi:hypothetical protein
MRGQVRKRKCKNCKDYFLPDHRNRAWQKFCSQSSCRKASKADSQRRWLRKPQNKDYFKGSVHVERVKRWRKSHPGYWRKKADKKTPLQDPLSAQTVDDKATEASLNENALQDVLSAQTPVLLGLIAQLTGSALQDDIATTARRLRQLGNDILHHQFPQKGAMYDLKTPLMSGSNPKTSSGVQLARSPSGP